MKKLLLFFGILAVVAILVVLCFSAILWLGSWVCGLFGGFPADWNASLVSLLHFIAGFFSVSTGLGIIGFVCQVFIISWLFTE